MRLLFGSLALAVLGGRAPGSPFAPGAPFEPGACASAHAEPTAIGRADGDLAANLADLSAANAAERARAERWLAAHLGLGDRELVVRAATAADAEGRRRLGRAIGAERRLLALAAELSVHAEPAAVEVGLDAVRELALAWSPGLASASLAGEELMLALQRGDAAGSVRLLSADVGAPLSAVLDLLRSSGAAPLSLVLDPTIAERATSRATAGPVPYVAGWSQLVGVLAGVHGLALEGFGVDPDGAGSGAAFLAFRAPRPPAVEPETGLALVQDWVRAVAGAGSDARDETGRRRRMEALLTTGWPAAWDWIGALDAAGDALAGEALVRAASGGVWPATWRDAARVSDLLAQLRLLQASGFEPRANLLARALASAPARLADGTATAELLGAAWDDALAPERRQLLVVLEGVAATGSPGARADWEARLRALFAETNPAGSGAGLVRQALRAWCAAIVTPETAPLSLRAPLALLSAPWSDAERRELGTLLRRSQAVPPPTAPGADPAAELPLDPIGARVTLLDWLGGTQPLERAGELLATSLDAPGADAAFAAALGRMVVRGDGDQARAILAAASARPGVGAGHERLTRTSFLAGLAVPEERAPLLAAAAAGNDLELLRAAAGTAGDDGDAARARLLELLGQALQGDPKPGELLPTLQAVEGAMADLLRAGADGDARDLRRRATARVLAGPRGSMQERLESAGWPQLPPPLDVLELALVERP